MAKLRLDRTVKSNWYGGCGRPVRSNSIQDLWMRLRLYLHHPHLLQTEFSWDDFWLRCVNIWAFPSWASRARLRRPAFLSIDRLHKFWLEFLCNLPIEFYPIMCYTIITVKERGNQNDLCGNVRKHNEEVRQKLRTVDKIQKILFYVSRLSQRNV